MTALHVHISTQARATIREIDARGLACPLVTGAGTGSFSFEAGSGVWGEIQCGSYCLMDAEYRQVGGLYTALQ